MEKSTFSVSYFLRKNKKYRNGSAPLLVRITYNGVRSEFTSNHNVKPEYWDQKSNRAIGQTNYSSYMSEVKVMNAGDIYKEVIKLFQRYNISKHLYYLNAYKNISLCEHQFAQFIGKTRLYQCLPAEEKKLLPELLMTDSQINIVAKSYYNDKDFGIVDDYKEISMWNVYNLLTGANKSSYIDNFLDRSLNASHLAEGICNALHGDKEYAWFID